MAKVKQGVLILLVEDDPQVAPVSERLVRAALGEWRPEMKVIETCAEALPYARTLKHDNWRLITDHQTPGGMNGDNLMTALDEEGLGGGRMLRFCSSHGNPAVVEELAGGTQVRTLHKPATRAEWKAAVQWLINRDAD